jgi:hypothetical protein
MTARVPRGTSAKAAKPRLFKKDGAWHCKGEGVEMVGATATAASVFWSDMVSRARDAKKHADLRRDVAKAEARATKALADLKHEHACRIAVEGRLSAVCKENAGRAFKLEQDLKSNQALVLLLRNQIADMERVDVAKIEGLTAELRKLRDEQRPYAELSAMYTNRGIEVAKLEEELRDAREELELLRPLRVKKRKLQA